MDKETRKKIVAKLEKNYDKIKKKLEKYPGFIGLEIGIKRKKGQLEDKIVYRACVKKKLPEKELAPKDMIPKEIDGFEIDVVEEVEGVQLLGRTDLPDNDKYGTIHGGIQVGNGTGSVGTAGCIALDAADNSRRMILSNQHVLYAGGAVDGQKIGHPDYSKSCCCDCNYIADNVTSDTTFDCAIALLHSDVNVQNTVEEIGEVKGAYTGLAAMDPVIKRGRTTGQTTGIVESVNMSSGRVVINVDEGRQVGYFDSSDNEVLLTQARNMNFVGLTQKYDQGSEKFAYAGDSGSVILYNDEGDPNHLKVVALLNSIDNATNTQGLGFLIEKVTNALNIEIHDSTTLPGLSAVVETPRAQFVDKLNLFERELSASPLGKKIVEFYYQYSKELYHIINNNRKAKVIWHRHKGPQFVAAVMKSIKDKSYTVPGEIEGISRRQVIDALEEIIRSFGSESLTLDWITHTPLVKDFALRFEKADELILFTRQWKPDLV